MGEGHKHVRLSPMRCMATVDRFINVFATDIVPRLCRVPLPIIRHSSEVPTTIYSWLRSCGRGWSRGRLLCRRLHFDLFAWHRICSSSPGGTCEMLWKMSSFVARLVDGCAGSQDIRGGQIKQSEGKRGRRVVFFSLADTTLLVM